MRIAIACCLALFVATPSWAGEGHDHKGHGHAHDTAKTLGAILPPYLRIQEALASDSTKGIAAAAKKLAAAAHKHHLKSVAEHAAKLGGVSLQADRAAFLALSGPVADAVLAHPAAKTAYTVFDCGQAPGRWVQQGNKPLNPYRGGALRACGAPVVK